jgi:phosphoribosylanthranilate isomerase
MTRVKVCGLMHEDEVATCVDAGVDALGFVVEYPVPVPWTLARQRAAVLMAGVPPFVARVAVVSGDASTLLGLARATGADVLQLHGDESPGTVEAVKAGLDGSGCRIVKALRVPPGAADPARWVALGERYIAAGADAILLDAHTEERPGGTGVAVNTSLAAAVRAAAAWPMVLAGGLTPATVGDAVRAVRPYGVDVLTGVEDERHRKVAGLVRAFVAATR